MCESKNPIFGELFLRIIICKGLLAFVVGFSFLCFVYFSAIKKTYQSLSCICVHFICVLTAYQATCNEHLSILQRIDSILLGMCSFDENFSKIFSDSLKRLKASPYSCNSIKQMPMLLSVVAR